jgi:DNA-binding XRE family transcriptional regulator
MNTKTKRTPARKSHKEMVRQWMKNPAFKVQYDFLKEEYELLREMLLARKRMKLTQEDVAKLMKTKAPAIARLESTSMIDKHSPSVNTLRKYAHAVGCTLEIHFRPL